MRLKHFSHKHLLFFNEVEDDGQNRVCYACQKPVLGPLYSCQEDCDFSLHKTCAELPQKILYPMHPQHRLILSPETPYPTGHGVCNACLQVLKGFTYHCSLCKFDIDIECAFTERSFQHKSHQHPLTLLLRSASLYCDACGTKGEDLSYTCSTCPFWIHKSCASLPNTTESRNDNHPLTLSYSLPRDFWHLNIKCDSCEVMIYPLNWLCFCARCRTFLHIKCAISEKKTEVTTPSPSDGEDEIRAEEDLNSDILHLPVMDVHGDVIGKLEKNVNSRGINTRKELKHFAHEHPLVLFDEEYDNEGKNEKIVCNGCIQLITAPFYKCAQCEFFLHKICAQLPRSLQHPVHPQHPLFIGSLPDFFEVFLCHGCKQLSNGLFFKCEICNFFLDVKCASLPATISHEAHSHSLVQKRGLNFVCNACGSNCSTVAMTCNTCNFHLEPGCALLPRTTRHRWDKHPLTLSYPPFSYHPDEFYCEICELEIHPKFWLYHCRECDYSFHPRCILQLDEYSNIKFGGSFKVDNHPHPLTFVHSNEAKSTCDYCGESLEYVISECAPCKFHLCRSCVREISLMPSSS